jgi:aminopeptidase
MSDPRYLQLARSLTQFSTRLQAGDRVLLDAFDIPVEMTVALIRAAREAGALPFVQISQNRVNRELLAGAEEAQYELLAQLELARMQQMDAYIAIRGSHNVTELSDVPGPRMGMAMKKLKPVMDHRVRKTRWCVLRWPTEAMAQQAGMSTEAFEDFFFRVCLLDYSKMQPGMAALKERLDRTDLVTIKGPDTDLRFSVKGINTIVCGGAHNIPDGEVFTCPVRDSVQGYVSFNAPTIYQGVGFDNIRLEFADGKIVRATGNPEAKINEVLDADEGARYIGEFSLAFNPHVLQPMRDILFDEKISGSFHFTPGQAYEDADNGNHSQVHWDMVSIQRPEYGGGEIYFDGELIRRDGLFVPAPLQALNPDRLLG